MKKYDNLRSLNINSTLYQTRLGKKFENRKPYKPADPRLITAFIPGTVLEIYIKEGQKVKKGEELLILEAMKMQNKLKSPVDGRISKIVIRSGDRVSKGMLLIELE